uniref:Sodium-coupled monocarboxylate transporter 1 n=1 Tax=Romanomermis culicivorax TaxID=13658 RepID=A0A915J7G9_ROMCU
MQIADYVVFVAILVSSAAVGFYHACRGGRQRTNREFLMADRNMPVFPVAMSLMATILSAISILGLTSELYFYGTMYWTIILAYLISITLSSTIVLPILYDLKLTSAYEYLEIRFHKSVRRIASFNAHVQSTIYMGICLYAPSLALEAASGIKWSHTVLALGVVCTFYTTIGGMKAVLWTDALQILVMLGGMLAISLCGCYELGGFWNVVHAAKKTNRIDFFDLDADPLKRHSFWSLTFGASVIWTYNYGSNQSMVQRYLTCRTKTSAQRALWINFPGLTVIILVCGFTGLVAFARYQHCDPLSINLISKNDQILPFYVADNFGHIPGFTGLCVATIFSAAMSSISSSINALAALTLEDFIKPYFKMDFCWGKNRESEDSSVVTKILAVFYGCLAMLIAFAASEMENLNQSSSALFGVTGGPIVATFFLGLLFPSANWEGALAGLIIGVSASLHQSIGSIVFRSNSPTPTALLSTTGCPNATGSIIVDRN